MSDMNSVLLYPSDVDNFGFDWGNLALTVGPTVNGAPRRFPRASCSCRPAKATPTKCPS